MDLARRLADHALPLEGGGLDGLVRYVAGVRFVLLGEATHGTHEFYALRAEITRRLITEHGFDGVMAEADWPDAWRVNRYVQHVPGDADANAALMGFQRFPTWMWRNTVARDFVEWLRTHNAGQPAESRSGFWGMDLYSLFGSIQAVLAHLDRTDPEAAQRARERYACFDHAREDSQRYGWHAGQGLHAACQDEVLAQLREMNERSATLAAASGPERERAFHAQQNARLVRNAERYYRTMFQGHVSSWNLRDSHMVETLDALEAHLASSGRMPRLVVWAHNSHLGDASATEMSRQGEWNVGQLVRGRWGQQAMLVGFTTHHGTVTAASAWDGPAERKRVRDALPGSCEALFHAVAAPDFWLALREDAALRELLARPLLQRAIGVIYQPRTERQSHYFDTTLPAQFDAVVHLDETSALEPLDGDGRGAPAGAEPAETYPSGM